VTLFPEKKLGIAAITNLGASPLPGHATLDAVDRLLGLEPANWSARNLARRDAGTSSGAPKIQPVPATRPSRDLIAFTGNYRHEGYGDLRVMLSDRGLRASYNDMPMALAHWHYDVFNITADRGEDSDLNNIKIVFQSDETGKVSGLTAKLEDSTPPSFFKRVVS
jgi:Domain of unknown function (DUF3471)